MTIAVVINNFFFITNYDQSESSDLTWPDQENLKLDKIHQPLKLIHNKLTELVCPSTMVRRKKPIESERDVSSYTYINTRALFFSLQHYD